MNKERETIKIILEGRKQKGITLIALVITIIVLLILAGVVIATLSGDNGILTNANKAKSKNKKAEEEEKVKLILQEIEIAQKTGKTLDEIDECESCVEKDGVYIIKLSSGNLYKVDENGKFLNEGELPSRYQKVEYLQGDGKPYIDSGNVYNNIEIDMFFKTSSDRAIMGSDNTINFWWGKSATNTIDLKGRTITTIEGEPIDTSTFDPTTRFVVRMFNGSQRFFFRLSKNVLPGDCTIYNIKIYSDNTYSNLIKNFVPCYRKIDNKPGMYDIVNYVFYTNAGNGEFTVGPDIN